MSFPENITTVPVTARLLAGTADGPKPTTERQAVSAQLLVDFTPELAKVPAPTAVGGPVTFYRAGLPEPVRGVIDTDGYLCTPDPDNDRIPMLRGVRLIATDDPALSVKDWTWRVSIKTLEGREIEAYSVAIPQTAATDGLDLTLLAPVPASPGYGLPQAEAAAAAAGTSATSAAASALEAKQVVVEIRDELPGAVRPLVVSALAADNTVVQAAAAAVDANPKIVEIVAKQPIKCVRLENGKWVWDTAAGTHYVIPDADGSLVVRPTAQPVPTSTPALNW